MVKIARMYYDRGVRQQEISERLSIHQSTISRLLKKARGSNVVRITVVPPAGVYGDLEDALERKFGLIEAIIVDSQGDSEERLERDLGTAAAFFLENTLKKNMIVGISPWGRSLLTMVETLNVSDRGAGGKVVQILGGVVNDNNIFYGTQLAQRLAASIGASPILLQAPAVVGSTESRRVLSADPTVREAMNYYDKIDLAFIVLGGVQAPKIPANSNTMTFSTAERDELIKLGAVGNICMRFIDAKGKPIRSPLMNRVMGIDLASLKKAKRIVGIAGGEPRVAAIHSALAGGWINVLITDRAAAEGLLSKP